MKGIDEGKIKMKRLKRILVALVFSIAILGSSVSSGLSGGSSVEAASVKNPTIKGMKGEIQVGIWLGTGATHKLSSVKLDGKDVTKKVKMSTPSCVGNCHYYGYFSASKGTYKVEVRDNKGYWTIAYVTVK